MNVTDIGPVKTKLVSTPIRYHLLKSWLALLNDPALPIADWLIHGAPAGIEHEIPDIGVFPSKDDHRALTPEELDEVATHFDNYSSLEDHPDAEKLMQDILDPEQDWVATFDTLDQCKAYLGGRAPIVSPLGVVSKDIKDAEGTVIGTKDRLILDPKKSRSHEAARAPFALSCPSLRMLLMALFACSGKLSSKA